MRGSAAAEKLVFRNSNRGGNDDSDSDSSSSSSWTSSDSDSSEPKTKKSKSEDTGKIRDPIWQHYLETDDTRGYYKCRYCSGLRYPNSRRLKEHLRICPGNIDPEVKAFYISELGPPGSSNRNRYQKPSNETGSDSDLSGPSKKKSRQEDGGNVRDPIWQHYEETDDTRGYYMCRYCSGLRYPNSRRLKEHLRICPGNIDPEVKAYYIRKLGPPGRSNCNRSHSSKAIEESPEWSSSSQAKPSRLKSFEYLKMKLDDRGIALGYILGTYRQCQNLIKGHQWADPADKTFASELLDEIWNAVVDTTVGCDDLFDQSKKQEVPNGMTKSKKKKQAPPHVQKQMTREEDDPLALPSDEEFSEWTTTAKVCDRQQQPKTRTSTRKKAKTGVKPNKPKNRKDESSTSDTLAGSESGSDSEVEEVVTKIEVNEECILPDLGNEISTAAVVQPLGITDVVSVENEKCIYDFYTAYQNKGIEWIYDRTCHYGIDRAQLDQIIQHYNSSRAAPAIT